jgi:taurine dioxygenase
MVTSGHISLAYRKPHTCWQHHAALTGEVTHSVEVEALEGSLGARVHGVDARRPIGSNDLAVIRRALVDRRVLFFRGQDLNADEHLAFAAQFGVLCVDPVSRLAGRPKVLSYIEDTEQRPPAEFPWHTDLSWLRAPPAFGILNARAIPDRGGDTIWVDLFAVYDALPAGVKRRVQQLRLRHRPQPHFFETVRHHHGDRIADRLVAENPPVEHPLVRPHPFDGRPALFLSPLYADSVVGLSPSQSTSLLALLERYLDESRFQIRWQWEQHDLVIWDEASTNHRALGDHYPRYRRMQRCSVEGSVPYFRAVS